MAIAGRWMVIWTAVLLWAAAPLAAQEPQAGNPQRGEALYVGIAPFEQGGAPCLGCHGIAGAGLGKAAGASYGPDLTSMFDNFGAEGVDDILQSMPFPSMEALYVDRPLTAQERADLTTYLEQVSGLEPPRIAGVLVSEAFAGLAVLFIAFYIFGRRRLSPVRSALNDPTRSHHKGEI